MEKKIIQDLFEYLNEVKKIIDQFKSQGEYRIYYRGEPNSYNPPMVPSVFRNDTDDKDIERNTYLRALRHHPNEFSNSSSLDIISKLQHFGYRTRMLDFTVNSLVALFFACAGDGKSRGSYNEKDERNESGHVYIYKADYKNQVLSFNSDRALLLSIIPKLNYEHQKILSKIVQMAYDQKTTVNNEWVKKLDENQRFVFGKYLHNIVIERNGFETHHMEPNDLLNGFFVKPNFANNRLKNQGGLFAIFGLGKRDFKSAFNCIENDNFFDIKISKYAFDSILRDLDYYFNIGFSSLFDDLESTALAYRRDIYKKEKSTTSK